MKTFIIAFSLALAFALPTYAAPPTLCVPGPDLRPCVKGSVKVNGRCTVIKEVPVEVLKEVQLPCSPVTVIKEVPVPVPGPVQIQEVIKYVEVEKVSPWDNMVFAQFGAHLSTNGYPSKIQTQEQLNGEFNNWGSYNIGTEFHFKPAHLGLRTFVGNNGIGGMLQVFPVQGRLSWHIDAGAAYTQYPFYRPSVPVVQRYWDLQVGTGIEYAFTEHIIGLFDLKSSIPLPWTDAPPLDWNTVGKSFEQTAALVGIGYRF